MKSLKTYALNLTEEQYHEYPAWSYSLIARYAREGFSVLPILHDRVTPNAAMEFGSLFDTMITRPDDVSKEYVVSDVIAPDAEKRVFDALLQKHTKPFAELSDDEIQAAIAEADYQRRWGFKAQYDHLAPYAEYYDTRASKPGCKIIGLQTWKTACDMMKNFYANPFVASLFKKDNDHLYQVQFLHKMNFGDRQVDVKVMFDMLVIDHENKTIQPVDLKTSSFPGYEFANSFVKMRYDLQAELYTDVLNAVIAETEYADYTVLPFIFTCISSTDQTPVTYVYDPADGLSFKDYSYKGWKSLLLEILGYEESNAKAPSYIKLDEPNDIRTLLDRDKWQKDIS